MPDRRDRTGKMEDLLPEDRAAWARDIWADRTAIAMTGGAWELRTAATILGFEQEVVDALLQAAPRWPGATR